MTNVTVQVLKAMAGYGGVGDVITIPETAQSDYLTTVGVLATYTGPISPGLPHTDSDLLVVARVINVGPVLNDYLTAISGGGANSAYAIVDKNNTASDASLLLSDRGNIRAEIGLAADNNLHLKLVTGTAGSETFTDYLILQTDGTSWFPAKLGIGTVPTDPLHVAGGTARTNAKIENTLSTGSSSAAVELKGHSNDWSLGCDVGENGNINFYISDNVAGYPPRVLIDGAGNVAIGKDTATYKLDVVGDVAANSLGHGFRAAEGANAKQGITAAMVAGAITVANASVTANSRIFPSRKVAGGTLGHVSYSVVAGTSFTLTSSSATETSTFVYEIFEPA